jgi:hypothetical protein
MGSSSAQLSPVYCGSLPRQFEGWLPAEAGASYDFRCGGPYVIIGASRARVVECRLHPDLLRRTALIDGRPLPFKITLHWANPADTG